MKLLTILDAVMLSLAHCGKAPPLAQVRRISLGTADSLFACVMPKGDMSV